jgi:outer membrane biosynthesis protein TonB
VPHYTKKDMIACFKQHMNLDEGIVQGLKLSQRVPPPLDEGKGESNEKPVEKPKTPERATKKMQRLPSPKQKLRKRKHVHTETPKQKRGRPKKRARTEEEEEEDDKEHDYEPDATGGSLTQDMEPNEDTKEK